MTEKFDVLVIGAGAAGLYTALCLPEHLHVGSINKNTLPVSASDWAQGGIAAAIAPEDSAALHVQDTLAAGAGLCDLAAVKFLVEEAPDCIDSLVKMGVAFDRAGPDLALTLEAAHSRRRVLHSADTTGKAVIGTLTAKVLSRQNIQVVSPAFALSLWLDKTGRCAGISTICGTRVKWLQAKAVVLATGGGGQVFAQTTNPSVSTGDGVAIGWRAGALLRDLEFVQFHPTALSKVGAPRFLISEAVRGEGAHLVDSKGYRFAFDYHPNGELAPRDVVSRAIFRHLQKTGEPHVWLDLRPIAVDRLRYRFPNIIQVCADWGIDIFSEPIPVTPAAHYWMGGIVADKFNQTSIPGLYAVGETASTGVHGANRLASNSLLECLVFGAQMAHLEVESENSQAFTDDEDVGEIWERSISQQDIDTIEKLRVELPSLVWQSAGICRGMRDLESAIVQVDLWRQEFASLPLSQTLNFLRPGQIIDFSPADAENSSVLRNWGEVGNLLDISYLILKSAAFRTESRGGHYRVDYPLTDRDWCRHTLIHQSNWYKSGLIED
ncbi:L-aspartate oxidase [Microcoleus sp. LEGE 07076]|uniref:L-aspartate oxidase n=1 Tax=Microcoleus sp. LEGE 07076 TaxID=915322 RepID=UPI001880D68F|nr:L-aspartate oxidase [Microcoleus sp. LEGE 07076]MBE9185852.1 L-aspartate oxidase [Microcoleus sp. LEGE 07076]